MKLRLVPEDTDFYDLACGQADGKYEGFHIGSDIVQLSDRLLIEPEAAKQYGASMAKPSGSAIGAGVSRTPGPPGTSGTASLRPKSFHGTVEVPLGTANTRLVQMPDEIV